MSEHEHDDDRRDDERPELDDEGAQVSPNRRHGQDDADQGDQGDQGAELDDDEGATDDDTPVEVENNVNVDRRDDERP